MGPIRIPHIRIPLVRSAKREAGEPDSARLSTRGWITWIVAIIVALVLVAAVVAIVDSSKHFPGPHERAKTLILGNSNSMPYAMRSIIAS